MPIYEGEPYSNVQLQKIKDRNVCAACGANLCFFYDMSKHKAFLACWDWFRTFHEGIEREASRYEKEGLAALNIKTREEIMVNEHGLEKTSALAKYTGTVAITKSIATEIVETLWGNAPAIEKTKAILLCQTYQLNPLMKHLHLIGYKRHKDKKLVVDSKGNPILDWSIMIGIGATRLMAQRKHNYSYMDFTPRKATKAEIDKILGDTADPNSIYGFTHIKDMDTGAEAFGLRGIPRNANIKGQEKGNTHLNMACVRSERQAIDRQYPGEMPAGVEVFDERYAQVPDIGKVNKTTGEIAEGEYREVADATPDPGVQTEEPTVSGPEAESIGVAVNNIDMVWLGESLQTLQTTNLKGWTEGNLLSYMKTTYKVEANTVLEAVTKLDKGQATHFVNRVQETLAMA